MGFSSLRFCKTGSRRSSVPSCGCALVETRYKRSKAFAVAELLAELVRGREFIHIVDLTVRSVPPVKWHAVPGSVAFLGVTRGSGSGLAALRTCPRHRHSCFGNVRGPFGRLSCFGGRLGRLRGRRLAA